MQAELKPCPFCGKTPPSRDVPWAMCRTEGCALYLCSIPADMWNTRPIPTPADCAKWEALREALREALGQRTPWPVTDVLNTLRIAVNHLLADHNCDHQGYEAWGAAGNYAAHYISKIGKALATLDAPKEQDAQAERIRAAKDAVLEAAEDEAKQHEADLPYECDDNGCGCPLCVAVRNLQAARGV